jgi:hypothetical protein
MKVTMNKKHALRRTAALMNPKLTRPGPESADRFSVATKSS